MGNKPKLNQKRLTGLMVKLFLVSVVFYGAASYFQNYLYKIRDCKCSSIPDGTFFGHGYCNCNYEDLVGFLDLVIKVALPIVIISVGTIAFLKVIIPIIKKLKKYLYTNENI